MTTMNDYPLHRELGAALPGAIGAMGGLAPDTGSVLPRGFGGAQGAARTGRLRRLLRTDQTVNNSVTPVTVTDLCFNLGAHDIWFVQTMLRYHSSEPADFRFQMLLPAGATFEGWGFARFTGTSPVFEMQDSTAIVANGSGVGPGTERTALIWGMVLMDTTPGQLCWQFAQGVAEVSDTVLHAKSFLLAERLSFA